MIARPSIPSWRAIASAVTAWSPVIIRTLMPADFALAIASRASARGGSTMPTSASSSRSVDERQQVGVRVEGRRVEVPLRGRHDPKTLRPQSIVLGQVLLAALVGELEDRPIGPLRPRGAREELVRGALHEGADDVAALASLSRWNVAMNLYAASNGSVATRGYCSRVSVGSTPPFAARTTSAPSVGSPTSAAVADLGVGAKGHRQEQVVERNVRLAADVA